MWHLMRHVLFCAGVRESSEEPVAAGLELKRLLRAVAGSS